MEGLSPELIQTLATVGGTPLVVLVIIWRYWNGTGKQITQIAEDVGELKSDVKGLKGDFNEYKSDTNERLTRVETIQEMDRE